MKLYDLDDTICAVATPPGVGGISVIRLCGERSLEVISKVCGFIPGEPETHRAYYGLFVDTNGKTIDEVIVTFFMAGRSFTGNDVFEISCHGNQTICHEILNELVRNGARLAYNGEFTYRAFCNGRIDLIQAESVLSLIHSSSKKASSLSLANIKGNLSLSIENMMNELTDVLANFEANIDFSVQDIEVLPVKEFEQKVKSILADIDSLISSYSTGKKVFDGYNVTLVGLPNSGKSSLLNNLIGLDKAIVTDVPGTTRDIVNDYILVNGMKINFYDTAGIRTSNDPVEKIGIMKAIDTIEESDVIFLLHDCSNTIVSNDIQQILEPLSQKTIVFINTKIDRPSAHPLKSQNEFNNFFSCKDIFVESFICINNLDIETIGDLFKYLDGLVDKNYNENSAIITHARHYEHLLSCKESLLIALENISKNESPEFIASDLHTALNNLYGVVGKVYTDEVMDKVFQKFCIGK